MSEKDFYVIIKRKDGRVIRHAVESGMIDQAFVDGVFKDEEKKSETPTSSRGAASEESKLRQSPLPNNFLDVERSFSQSMMMYRNSVIETIRVAPAIARVSLGRGIDAFVKTRGTKIGNLSSGDTEVYSLPGHSAGTLNRHYERADTFIEGARHLPIISTIGIISSYDAILTDLLRVVFTIRPEIIFTSDREIKFSDLVTFSSINDVRESIVGNEIESVMRQSHHEQFSWMEKKFGMKLKEGLDVWPDFIELCERRNLLTHTGGIISEQYLKNCTQHGMKPSKTVGDKLVVDLDYLKRSISIVSEVGYKLIHTLWRKFCPHERERADTSLNDFGMSLIAAKKYDLAEKVLEFGVRQKSHSSDRIKRMMIVNLANAAKLSGDKERCDKQLASHDWSATSLKFQISVAAVRNDFQEVRRLMLLGGNVIDITASEFRNWPVFKDARKDSSVREAFEEVFGESLVKADEVTSRSSSVKEPLPNEEETDPKGDN